MKKYLGGLLTFVMCVGLGPVAAFALIPNGDFETGDLNGYYFEESRQPVNSSPLINNVDDGTGNRVGEVLSPNNFSNSERIFTLGKDLGPLSPDVEDLFFDVKFFDLGPEIQPLDVQGPQALSPAASTTDFLYAVLNVDGFNENLFILDDEFFYNRNPYMVSREELDNGFYRIRTHLSSYAGSADAKLQLYMNNTDDHYNSKFWVDNIDLTSSTPQAVAPEPATMLLMGGGLAGMIWRRRRMFKKS